MRGFSAAINLFINVVVVVVVGGKMRIRRGSESCFSHLQMIRNMLRVNVRRAVTSGAAMRGVGGIKGGLPLPLRLCKGSQQ